MTFPAVILHGGKLLEGDKPLEITVVPYNHALWVGNRVFDLKKTTTVKWLTHYGSVCVEVVGNEWPRPVGELDYCI